MSATLDARTNALIQAIGQLECEINDHLQDEQGDWDDRPVRKARKQLYALLGIDESLADFGWCGAKDERHFGCVGIK